MEWKVFVDKLKIFAKPYPNEWDMRQHPDFKIDKGVKDADIRRNKFLSHQYWVPGLGLNSNISSKYLMK